MEPSWLTFGIFILAVLILAGTNALNFRTIRVQRKTINTLMRDNLNARLDNTALLRLIDIHREKHPDLRPKRSTETDAP